MAYTVWERLVRADLGVDPKKTREADRLALDRMIHLLDRPGNDYDKAKMVVILDRIPDHNARRKLKAARRRQSHKENQENVKYFSYG